MGSQRLGFDMCFVTGWAWLYMMAWWCNAFTTTPEPLYLAFWTVVCSPLLKSSPNSKSLKKIVLSAPNILATPSIVKASLKSHTGKAASEFCLDGLSLAGIAVDAVPTSLGKEEGSQGSLDSIRAQSRRRLASSRFSAMARPRFRSSAVRLSASAQATMEFLSSKNVASDHIWPLMAPDGPATVFHIVPPSAKRLSLRLKLQGAAEMFQSALASGGGRRLRLRICCFSRSSAGQQTEKCWPSPALALCRQRRVSDICGWCLVWFCTIETYRDTAFHVRHSIIVSIRQSAYLAYHLQRYALKGLPRQSDLWENRQNLLVFHWQLNLLHAAVWDRYLVLYNGDQYQ